MPQGLIEDGEHIVKDKDGDLWEEITPGEWECKTLEIHDLTFAELEENYGPLRIFREMVR